MVLAHVFIGIIAGLISMALAIISGSSLLAALGLYAGIGVVATLLSAVFVYVRCKISKSRGSAQTTDSERSPAWASQSVSAITTQRR